ncbi:glycerol-3-phosphate 1-O-acyltransferase PlsY [Acuticoccus kandeliae]|uniref:glycerol-3-phosphate 1-O-acyltransferase PlsY n=1 Tax=Acuticoccus kandeliae TaxID=2073160 RepID=UPI000D3E186C|nr:glycerol-3-phosphate 1-O-acyltransferase PlsY [Acuticoccus kandeliae]
MPDPAGWAATWPQLVILFVFAYFCGSIPFGLIFTRFAGLGDVRKIGSGNIGATNVLRTGRKDLAALTLLFDAVKGVVPVIVGAYTLGDDGVAVAAVGAFLGHLFPVWLKFRGGKGVATYVGCLFAAFWPAGLSFAVIWIGVAYLMRYSSLAALLATLATPFVLVAFDEYLYAEVFALLTAFLWFKHRANIRRLVAGEETRIGQPK